jgi:hypothetical protein
MEFALNPKWRQKMDFPVIPWKVFIDALQHQQPSTLELRLHRCLFTNEGVIMATSVWQDTMSQMDSRAAEYEALQA